MVQGSLIYILGTNVARARDAKLKTNPNLCLAPYFGFKFRLDQNKKIGRRYGGAYVD